MNLFDEWQEVKNELLSRINSTPVGHGGYPNTVATGGITSANPMPVSINAGGVIMNVGSSGYYATTGNSSIGYSLEKAKPQSMSPDLPTITMDTEDENHKPVVMTLKPEPGISSGDLCKLMMLCMAYANAAEEFNALAYVKKHNLERHFTYA